MSTSGQDDLISQLLDPAVQQFIRTHESADVHSLSLKYDAVEGIPFARIAEQIAGRHKARHKLPQYFATRDILYPPATSLEQSSSKETARFRLQLLNERGLRSTSACLDLTGGFGVDAFYFSQMFSHVDFVEPDPHLIRLAQHNHEKLGRFNIGYHNVKAEDFLRQTTRSYDLIYLDPSRRAVGKERVIELTRYSPDLESVTALARHRAPHILIKASPMLDIQRGVSLLPSVTIVSAVAVNNEVRELLFFCDTRCSDELLLEAATLTKGSVSTFSFHRSEEKSSIVHFADPLRYLYEPHAAILKVGGFNTVAGRYGLSKLHRNTHLYTSGTLVAGFPGRIFSLEATAKKMNRELSQHFPEGKANVVVRNYPLSADELRAKAGLKDGGEMYLLGFTAQQGKMLAVARRTG